MESKLPIEVELIERISIELPFSEGEVTDGILKRSISKAIGDLNKWYPLVVRSNSPIQKSELINVYSNRYDYTTFEPYAEDYLRDFGLELYDLYQYSIPWKIEILDKLKLDSPSEVLPITNLRVARGFFFDLAIPYAGMFMANIRRGAALGSLPFDIKGDQFFQEFSEKLESAKSNIRNNSPQLL